MDTGDSITSFLGMYRVYTNEWWCFVSGFVKADSHCTLCFCLFDSPTQKVFIHGTVVDFIHLKKFL
jgi:hypothetical protein